MAVCLLRSLALTELKACSAAAGGWYWWTQNRPAGEDPALTFYGNVDIRQIVLRDDHRIQILWGIFLMGFFLVCFQKNYLMNCKI